MTPDQLLRQLERQAPGPAYLFIGPELYERDRCRHALVERLLPETERETGLTPHDLDEVSLAAVLDDARSFSLFAPRRLIWVSHAEAALPRGRASATEEDEMPAKGKAGESPAELEEYLKDPSPGVTLVLDCRRYELEGEDKAKLERVKKFYAAISHQVEFAPYMAPDALRLAHSLVRQAGVQVDEDALALLVESVGASAACIAQEAEKLRLFAGSARRVTTEDIARLVPQARVTTIFALVAALGRRDRTQALDVLDTLVREGGYLPLALSFLATQFRQALVAKEAGLRTAPQIQAHFARLGTPMWTARAEQVRQTVAAFTREQIEGAIRKIAAADKALRDTRPDDRVVMEDFVVNLGG